jgi:hypothetical protein
MNRFTSFVFSVTWVALSTPVLAQPRPDALNGLGTTIPPSFSSGYPATLDGSGLDISSLNLNPLGNSCQGAVCLQINLRRSATGELEPSASLQFSLGSNQAEQIRTQRILAELRIKEFEHKREMEVMERLAKSVTENNLAQVAFWVQLLAKIRGTSTQTILAELASMQGGLASVLNNGRAGTLIQEVRLR